MAIIPQKSLFSWKNIESASDLDRLSMVLRVIPDEALMKCLEKERDKGRDDYPVRAVWNSILAGIIFQHISVASLRRELSRNGQLRQLCGFDPVKGSSAIPPAWGYTRFLSRLFRHQEAIEEMFNTLVDQLEKHLEGFGENLAIDSKAAYGRIVRAPLDKDRRIFVPVVRDSPKWNRLYNKRTSVERVNSRLDCSFGFERHYIRGLKKMRLQVSLALIVMLSMALASVKEGREKNLRSLVDPFRLKKAA